MDKIAYKKVLIGNDVYWTNWYKAIYDIKKPNVYVAKFTNEILDLIKKNNIDYIIPLTLKDYEFIWNIPQIDKKMILHPTKEIWNLLNNKLEFTKFMYENFYNLIPHIYFLDNKQIEPNIVFPMISKPMYSTGGVSMKILISKRELNMCKNKIIIQKYIENPCEYSAYIICKDGKIINHKVICEQYDKQYIKKQNFKNYITPFSLKIGTLNYLVFSSYL